MSDVAATALAAFADIEDPTPAVPDAELVERVRGLLVFVASRTGALRESARAELASVGPDAIGPLGGALADARLPDAERIAAAEALARFGGPHAAAILLRQAEQSKEAWVRAQCVWRLGETDQDWVVPRLVVRLEYENDDEGVLWLADTLARFGNFAGLERLEHVARSAADATVRETATARLAARASEHGSPDAEHLRQCWNAGESNLVAAEPARSRRYEREVWRWIDRLRQPAVREWDDSRFALARLGATSATWLAAALHDADANVRIQAAQCLAGMGPRAWAAGTELVAGLAEAQLAPHAAAALGRLGFTPAGEQLARRLDPGEPLELRVAAARALGFLRDAAPTAALTELATGEATPIELAAAAAESLLYLERPGPALGLVADLLQTPELAGAPAGARSSATSAGAAGQATASAVQWWLTRRADARDERARDALERWDVEPSRPGVALGPEELREQRRRRAEIVRALATP